jgi:hypothetical protein
MTRIVLEIAFFLLMGFFAVTGLIRKIKELEEKIKRNRN